MSTVRRGTGFPLLALLLGAVGTLLAAAGVLGLVTPEEAAEVVPALGNPGVVYGLLGAGGVLILIEAAMIVGWARRRAGAAGPPG